MAESTDAGGQAGKSEPQNRGESRDGHTVSCDRPAWFRMKAPRVNEDRAACITTERNGLATTQV